MKILQGKKGKCVILILTIIMIIGLIIASIIFLDIFKANTQNNKEIEEFVQIQPDGTKVNTSTRLKETKLFEELEVKINELTNKDNVTTLKGRITNNTDEIKGDYAINIHILDKQGNEITMVGGYVGEIAPHESINLSASATFDYANAYDYFITKHDNAN